MLYDSHTHINEESLEGAERKEFIDSIQKAVDEGKLLYVNDIGFDLQSSKMAADHAAKYPWCYAVVGVHPQDCLHFDEATLSMIKGLAKKDKVKAIGEIGIDYHYGSDDKEEQRACFRAQIRLANELKMPIVIHSREADQEVMDILKEEGAFSEERKGWFPKRKYFLEDGSYELVSDARVLLHCYSGSAELAKQYIKLGATISVAGPVTYKNNRKTCAVVETVPIEFLLVETDAPYLTPVPLRGERNRSPYVEYTAKKVAELKGMEFDEVARITTENSKRFFNI